MTFTVLLKKCAVEEFNEEFSLFYYEQMVLYHHQAHHFFDTHAICLRNYPYVLPCMCISMCALGCECVSCALHT